MSSTNSPTDEPPSSSSSLQHPLCETAQLLAAVLDGASERAVLIASDGRVLHLNPAARHFLYVDPTAPHVTDFLKTPDWQKVEHCHVVMKPTAQNQNTVPTATRTERSIHLIPTKSCPCGCAQQYYTAYICSKHERVREAVDHAFDPVITVDELGIIYTANEAVTALFGYAENELVGKEVGMICGGGHAENHAQYMQNYLETGVKKIIGRRREVLGRKKDGTEFPCQLGVQEMSDASSGKRYFSGFLKDLTMIKEHEAALQERQDLAQGMIDASFDGMLEIDEAGVIKIVNNAACNMFGYTRDEFVGSNVSMICGEGHAEHHASYIQRYLTTGQRRIIGRKRQVKARRKDGSEIEVELGVQEVVLSGGKKAFCGYIRDCTERKKDKRALRKQAQMIHNKFFGEPGEEEGGK